MASFEPYSDPLFSPDLEARVQAELAPGEKVLWVGQPRVRRAMLAGLPIVLFGIPWTAFAVFWVALALGMGANAKQGGGGFPGGLDFCFPLFGLPFIVVGLAMITSPYWIRRAAANTCYAVTDRRAILWEPRFRGMRVRSYMPEQLTRISRTEYSDGSGDLVFEELLADYRAPNRSPYGRAGFMGIEHVHDVENLIRKTLLHQP